MRFHQLQAFVAVIDHGGIRAAARALNLSQAALTKSLRLLEEEAGSALLIRTVRGVTPTPQGLTLLDRARLTTRQFALIQDELRSSAGRAIGEIRIGLTPLFAVCTLAPAFARFRGRYPDIQLRIVDGLVLRVLPLLRSGLLDFAIVADSGNLPQHEFESPRIARASQCIVARIGHPAFRTPTVDFLNGCEWGLPTGLGTGVNPQIEKMFEQSGAGMPQRIIVGDTNVIMALASRSDIVTIIPSRLLAEPEFASMRPLRIPKLAPPTLDIRIVSRPEMPFGRPAEFLVRCLLEVIESSTSPTKKRKPVPLLA